MHLVQYRLRGGTVMNNVATIESERFKRGEAQFGGPDELEEIFSQCTPRVRDMLRYVSRDRNWALHDRDPVTNWTKGNVTLLGDAAHPTLQYLAQGACMAIEDAVVLAAEVARHGEDYNSRVQRLPAATHEPHGAGRAHGPHLRSHLPRRRRCTRPAQRAPRGALAGRPVGDRLAVPGHRRPSMSPCTPPIQRFEGGVAKRRRSPGAALQFHTAASRKARASQ